MKKSFLLFLPILLLITNCCIFSKKTQYQISTTNSVVFNLLTSLTKNSKEIEFSKITAENDLLSTEEISTIISSDIFIILNEKNETFISEEILNNKYILNLSEELQNSNFSEKDFYSIQTTKEILNILFIKIQNLNIKNLKLIQENFNNLQNELNLLYDFKTSTDNKKIIIFDNSPFEKLFSELNIKSQELKNDCSNIKNIDFLSFIKLINFCNEENVNTIYILDSTDRKIIPEIQKKLKNKNTKIITLKTFDQIDINNSYIQIQKENLTQF